MIGAGDAEIRHAKGSVIFLDFSMSPKISYLNQRVKCALRQADRYQSPNKVTDSNAFAR